MTEQDAAKEATTTYEERIGRLIDSAIQRSQEINDTVLLSITEECSEADPMRFFATAITSASERFYWEHPESAFTIASAGVLSGRIVSKLRRFQRVEEVRESTFSTAIIDPPIEEGHPGPILYAGFAFDPERRADLRTWLGYGSGYIVVPQATITRRGDTGYITVNLIVTPKRTTSQARHQIMDIRDRAYRSFERDSKRIPVTLTTNIDEALAAEADHFRDMVGKANQAVKSGSAEKIAILRRCELDASIGFDVVGTLERLRTAHPDAVTFALSRRDSAFLGSSPTRLVSLHDGNAETDCISGTAPVGESDDETERFGAELLGSSREQAEHRIGVNAARAALETHCNDVGADDEPVVRRAGNAQHLKSTVRGKLRDEATLVDLVAALHPSATVCGAPAEGALAFFRENEETNRGWYGAPFGWLDSKGNGEFIVAQRSALLKSRRAHIFATSGITGESDASQELLESELKLRPMIDALTAEAEIKFPEPPEEEQEQTGDADDTDEAGETDTPVDSEENGNETA